MIKNVIAVAGALMLFATGAAAQETIYADPDFDARARMSIGMEKKLFKGFNVGFEEELRFKDNLGSFDRTHTTLSLDWKLSKHLRAGAGYTLIYGSRNDSDDPASVTSFTNHRWYGELTGMYKYHRWRFSVRERFQSTTLTREINKFQQPQTAYVLRSRFKVSYDLRGLPVEPYGSIELRHALNGLSYSLVDSKPVYSYSDVYLNRTRAQVGVEWKVGRFSDLDFYLMGDYVYNKKYDANRDGTKMKTITYQPGYRATLGVAYKLKF